MRSFVAFVAFVTLGLSAVAVAAPPGEVEAVGLEGDRVTVTWAAVPGADAYHVYLGGSPADHDQTCRAYRVAGLSAEVPELPGPGGLLYVLVSAVNAEGEGPLGAPNLAPCADGDADLVADNLDNCPGAANSAQADQDGGGVGDACDPRTYDFEADAVGARPAGMTLLGGTNQALTVKDVGGDRAISYDLAGVGVHDRFERVLAGMPRQDTTVWLDYELAPEVASIELWSDGAYGWNAGNGVILQLNAAGGLVFYDRHAQSVPSQPGPAVPASGRLRIRLLKGSGTMSTLHVDAWDGNAFVPDHAVFPIADDHRYTGLGTVIADYFGGPRAITRITVAHTVPAASLTVRQGPSWSCDWKLYQRDEGGTADVPVKVFYALEGPGTLQARVVRSSNGAALAGFDWADHAVGVAGSPGAPAELVLAAVPAGGNYDVEVRLLDAEGATAGEGRIEEIAVGELFLAGGQSNMSGYSGSVTGAEAPVDAVHLFGNDYLWKRAAEPMDGGTDQVDLVSSESPAASLMLAFAKELASALGVPVGIVPGPLGGTNLHTQWQRNAAVHDDRGTLYGSLLHRARLQGGTPPRGLLWYQGESDAGRGTAAYRQDLERLMAQYREDLARPDLWYGIVQLATYDGANFATWIPIQEAHRQVVEADPRAVLAAAVDLPRADVIHLSVDGYKTVGRRLARELEEHLYGLPVDASARLVSVARGSGAKEIDLVYDRPVTGGSPALYQVVDAGGIVAVTSVTASGSTITLNCQGRPQSPVRVTYGYSKTPGAAWVKDGGGTAVAVFADLPVAD